MACSVCAALEIVPAYIHKIIETQLVCAEQRTLQWKKDRAERITASDVAAVIGDNFFTTRDEVLYRKLAALTGVQGDLTPFCGNDATEWGTNQESAALEAFCARTGHKVVSTGLLQHLTQKHVAGSPDGITWCGAIVEFKCPFKAKIYNVRAVPRHYMPQVQILMEITNLERAYFVQFRPKGYGCEGKVCPAEEEKFTILEVTRDREWAATHMPTLEKFINDLTRLVTTFHSSLLE